MSDSSIDRHMTDESHECVRIFGLLICLGDKISIYETKGGINTGTVTFISDSGITLDNEAIQTAVSYKRISKVSVAVRGKTYLKKVEEETRRRAEVKKVREEVLKRMKEYEEDFYKPQDKGQTNA